MKIGIDASRAFLCERTGTEEYSYKLLRCLAKIKSPENQFFLYVKKGAKVDFELPPNFTIREIGSNFLWTQAHLSLEILRKRIDVLFVPSHSIPIIHPRRTVAVVHGLEYKAFPKCYGKKEKLLLKINTLVSIVFAKKIIVPSENSRKDLMRFYKVKPQRIKVIHHGIDRLKNATAAEKNENEFNILFIGRIEKRKNIVGIVRAFENFMDESRAASESVKLILAGKKGFGFEEIEKEISDSPYRTSIFLPGYVSQEEKQKLYSSADVFIFPSFYEGFGIPVLEAMSYGVPVVCSATSSLGEVAGNAAFLVNPSKPREISSAILEIFQNEKLRNELRERGYENLKRFSWEKCAEATLNELTDWQ